MNLLVHTYLGAKRTDIHHVAETVSSVRGISFERKPGKVKAGGTTRRSWKVLEKELIEREGKARRGNSSCCYANEGSY